MTTNHHHLSPAASSIPLTYLTTLTPSSNRWPPLLNDRWPKQSVSFGPRYFIFLTFPCISTQLTLFYCISRYLTQRSTETAPPMEIWHLHYQMTPPLHQTQLRYAKRAQKHRLGPKYHFYFYYLVLYVLKLFYV